MLARQLLLRAVAAFLVLPGVMAFLIPLAIGIPLVRAGVPFRWLALLPVMAGTALLVWCAREFFRMGHGTLAPWHPPRDLVTTGPYAFSRNPMYVAVAIIIAGWAWAFSSTWLLIYLAVLVLAFHLRVRLGEEPWQARTFREAWTRYASRVPRWVFPSRRLLVGSWIAAVVIALFGGLVYEAYADAAGARDYPPPGMLVDVGGGRRLHLLCIGQGSPTVLFESSGFGNATSGAPARERISGRTRVCSYDRMGMGWSDAGPSSISVSALANDLAVLQDRAELGSPVLLVASSIGGLTAEFFARSFPERVSGLVLLDAATSELARHADSHLGLARAAGCTASMAARFGVVRLIDPFQLALEGSDGARRSAAMTYGARPWATMCAMAHGAPETLRSMRSAPPLPRDLPLVVLSASSDRGVFPGSGWFTAVRRERVTSHQQFAKASSRGRWAMVPDSGHLLAGDKPDVVADAVLEMLEAVQ